MRIAQVLNNLVSNAIKYSPVGGEVALCVRTDDADAVLEVIDHGIGIPPDELGRVFDPFHRSAVARKIVEAHAGRLDVESTLGVGSTFRVHLPLELQQLARDERPQPQV
jgi:signal transduction histidine kinase